MEQKVTENHYRDDYRELLELACIFLGGTPPHGIKFYKPGVIHNARFMSRAIYSIKMVLFKDQVKMTDREKRGLITMSVFVVLVYVKYLFSACNAINAPRNDFQFLKELKLYEKTDTSVFDVALKKFTGHLWYMIEELVGLSLFDRDVCLLVKRKMVEKFFPKDFTSSSSTSSRARKRSGLHRLVLRPKDVIGWLKKDLSDFVTPNTIKHFQRFGLEYKFISHDPATWHSLQDYKVACMFFSKMNVTNNVTEKGVALTQAYLEQVKSTANLQDLLIVTQASRRETSTCTKEALFKSIS